MIVGRWLSTVILLTVACADPGPAPPSIPFEEFRTEELRARCDYLVRCGLFADHARCTTYFPVALFVPFPPDESLVAAIGAGKVNYDGAAALQCTEQLAERSCDLTAREGREPLVCDRVFRGQVQVGELCTFDRACASGSCLLPACPPGSCCPGECEPGQRNPLGSACQSDVQCVAETFCGPERTCVALVERGGPCRSDAQCAYGLGCAGKTALMDGTCEELPLIGNACVGLRCAEAGAICNADGMCVAAGLAGDACMTDGDCSTFAQCGPAGTCIDIPQLGDACTGSLSCTGESYCSSMTNVCTAVQPDGAFCDIPQECEGRLCLAGEFFSQCATLPVCF